MNKELDYRRVRRLLLEDFEALRKERPQSLGEARRILEVTTATILPLREFPEERQGGGAVTRGGRDRKTPA